MTNQPTVISIDPSTAGKAIPPLLFGHNLEHTRQCVWRGLGAQILRNRKFCGEPGPQGVAIDWYAIGSGRTVFRLNPPFSVTGIHPPRVGTYTRHYEIDRIPWDWTVQYTQVESFAAGQECGIGQDKITLLAGRRYTIRVVLKSDRPLQVRLRLSDARRRKDYCAKVVPVTPGDWQVCEVEFVAAETDEYARLEITFDQPGSLSVGCTGLWPADTFLGLRSDVVELLGQLGITLLRWPGGNFAGDYRWKDGLLPVDQRGGLRTFGDYTLRFCNDFDDHEIGTDEFIALCRRIGAEPSITINVSVEGPQEAADWVEYCNGGPETTWGKLRAHRGHKEPYNVRYWSLGNEMGYGHMKGPNGVLEYLSVARQCAAAMRKIDPKLILTASGTWTGQWIDEVPSESYNFFDLISYHRYVPQIQTYQGDAGRAEVAKLLATPVEDRRLISECRQTLEKHVPKGRRIGIAYDEWNVWYAWLRRPLVAEGVYAAAFLNMICREAHAQGIDLAAFFEPVNEGAILVTPEKAWLTPIGRVMQLFKAHQGGRLIDLAHDVDDPTSVCASVSADGKRLVATVVNRRPFDQIAATLKLPPSDATAALTLLRPDTEQEPSVDFAREERMVPIARGGELQMTLPRLSVMKLEVSL